MSAFNRRFDIKRVAGLQLPMAAGLIGMLVSAVFALMLPWPLKLLVLCLFVFSAGAVVYVLWYGNDIAFARVIHQSRQQRQLSTAEHLNRL